MLLNSVPFIIIFPIAVLAYYLIPVRFRYVWLLLCSYLFYLSQSNAFVSLLILSTATTYGAGLFLEKVTSQRAKNVIVALTVVINIGIIAFIKYADFALSFTGNDARFNFFIPVGISFYTFQAVSYVIDCCRGRIAAERNIFKYALFVSFFPSLLSGPINRARDLMPYMSCDKPLNLEEVKLGMMKMLWGYFLKLVIAARLTIVVDNVYADADAFSGISLLFTACAYLFMLYCDFEGYSQIAIGAARILGIKMQENFRQPFYSLNMGELWSRWHVSLSSWLKEYLYFPLGGNRKGKVRRYLNILIVFFASGLWHGANFTFMIWGLMNGLMVAAGYLLKDTRDKIADASGFAKHTALRNTLKRIGVFALYGFTMIFFAADNVGNAVSVVRGIFTRFDLTKLGEIFTLGLGSMSLIFTIVLAALVLAADGYCYRHSCEITGLITELSTVKRWAVYLVLVILILFSANLGGREFIYAAM